MRLLFTICLLFFSGLLLSGQTLHFIFIAPDEATTGDAFALSLEQTVRGLARTAGLEVEWHPYRREVAADRLRKDLTTLETREADVLWLYYHGPADYDNEDLLEDFPYFELKGERVFLSSLHNILLSRPHQLCLSFLDGTNDQTGVIGDLSKLRAMQADKLRALLSAEGDLTVTGYGRYQTSNYHARHGGMFTSAFFQALQYVAGPGCNYPPIWAEVLFHADIFMKQMLGDLEKEQKHYHRLNIRGHDFAGGQPPRGPQFSGAGGPVFSYAIPFFQLPPPRASAWQNLSRDYFSGDDQLRDIDERLSNAIQECGYAEKSYYAVEGNGFALVTRLEQMNPGDATSLPPPKRWSAQVGGMEEFSIRNYLRALFFGESGSFRIFVFLVTAKPFNMSGESVSKEQTQEWLSEGLNRLPKELGDLPFTGEHTCTVLVYEFEQGESGEARFVESSQFSSETHLRQSRIQQFLKR